jgi:dethiobiotin synthase
MPRVKGLFIAATGQHVGKTTASLGIFSGLQKRFPSVGFIKPVGQRHVKTKSGAHVDKDVVLFRERFGVDDAHADMSPVIIPSGFTRAYLDGEVSSEGLFDRIDSGFDRIATRHDYVLVEGTGHVGVGSIIGMSNAQVAKRLGLDVVIVAPAGLGSTLDSLALNVCLCRHEGVHVRGVILNRVVPDKREMLLEYLPKAFARWEIPIIACIPYDDILGRPTMRDFEGLFKTKLISGHQHAFHRFDVSRIGARSTEIFREKLKPRQLTITPVGREDIIYEVLRYHQKKSEERAGGLILTERRRPSPEILEAIRKSDVPVLRVQLSCYEVLAMITSFTAKTQNDDTHKIGQAIRLVESEIDFDLLT